MDIELNPHFKDDQCVLMCGKHAYAEHVKRETPQEINITRTWFIKVQRPSLLRTEYICLHHMKASIVKERSRKTVFLCYEEAAELAEELLNSGNFKFVWIIEALREKDEEQLQVYR